MQLFDTSKRADLDRPHYPRRGGRWLSIVPHDLLLLFSKGALTAGGQLSTGHALPALAGSPSDEAFRRAQGCSTDKAVKYALGTAEPSRIVAEAAFDACESLWRAAPPNPTPQQLNANPYLASELVKAFAGRREAEIWRLRGLVRETRNGAHEIVPARPARRGLGLHEARAGTIKLTAAVRSLRRE